MLDWVFIHPENICPKSAWNFFNEVKQAVNPVYI